MKCVSRHIVTCLLAFALAMATAACGFAADASPGRAWADEWAEPAGEPDALPLVMIVAGFDGDAQLGPEGSPWAGQALPANDAYDWNGALFGQEGSLAAYYRELSGGKFAFMPARESCASSGQGGSAATDTADDGVVHVALHRHYGSDWGLINADPNKALSFAEAVAEAFARAEEFVDFGAYDSDGDGTIGTDELAVVVCVPGYDASILTDPARTDIPVMWPHAGSLAEMGTRAESPRGYVLSSYIAITENLWLEGGGADAVYQEPLGILAHELGHYLGLPDLYPLNPDAASGAWAAYGTGALSLMAEGGWAQILSSAGVWQFAPCALDGWSRYVLGWSMPEIADHSGDYTLTSQGSPQGHRSLLVPTPSPDEYYLIENRQPTGRDTALGSAYASSGAVGGIVAWHVDKRLYRQEAGANRVNDTDHHPAVMELFFEVDPVTRAYSLDWGSSVPRTGEPFFTASTVERAFGDARAAIDLPLYGEPSDGSPDLPANRTGSGVSLQVLSENGDAMTVRITYADETAAHASQEWAKLAAAESGTSAPSQEVEASGRPDETPAADAASREAARAQDIGRVACAALMDETGADAAIVACGDLDQGLPAGGIAYRQAENALPRDSNIVLYEATGLQLRAWLEDELEALMDQDARAQSAEAVCVGGLNFFASRGAAASARASGITVNGAPLKADATYQVAATAAALRVCGLDSRWSRSEYLRFGSPADALRSFVQGPDWERAASEVPYSTLPSAIQAEAASEAPDSAQPEDVQGSAAEGLAEQVAPPAQAQGAARAQDGLFAWLRGQISLEELLETPSFRIGVPAGLALGIVIVGIVATILRARRLR